MVSPTHGVQPGSGPAPPPSPPVPPAQHPPAPPAPPPDPPQRRWRRWVYLGLAVVGVGAACWYLIPMVVTWFNTVSTDDAYVNGHVTMVAPRVAGQVMKVFVEDNNRVKKGDVLVQLDREPYLVQLDIKKAAVTAATADLEVAKAQVRGMLAQTRSLRFKLEHSMEQVQTQIANLNAAVATYKSRKATLALAEANLKRGEALAPTGGISKEDLDQRRESVAVARAAADQALQTVYSIRVGLGLPAKPKNNNLAEVPPNLDQNYSGVREALGALLQSAAGLGIYPPSYTASPREVVADFYKRDPTGNLNVIFEHIMPQAPPVKQAEAKLLQTRADLEQAELNLRYCDVVSEIDGVVTRRNVNPGDNVQVAQSLMAVRSLTQIWVDANFKETQLDSLRIGQPVRLEVDMYGSHSEFRGRVTGFTMGTGQTLALLPPQNATGNFVKIVQRLPVRIDLIDYTPDERPLFVGLSVTPYVYYKEKAEGPNAGQYLQPYAPLPRAPASPRP